MFQGYYMLQETAQLEQRPLQRLQNQRRGESWLRLRCALLCLRRLKRDSIMRVW